MSRYCGRACDREAGFSFVELLVAIIIAGIAFAAMVPLFVSAQGKNSADEVRNIALNVAQEKIELIRELDWSDIVADEANPGTMPNLYNAAFHGDDFGPSWTSARGRTFIIDYDVESVANPSVPGAVAYKAVTVTVSWQPPPSPVKSVRLTTFVYQQFRGAKVLSVTAAPLVQDWGLSVGQSLPSSLPDTVKDPLWPGYINGSVTLTATTSAAAEMVTFYVYSGDGAQIAGSLQVLAPNDSTTTFTTPAWTPPAGTDGWFFFNAVATAAGYSGNTVQQTYYVETGAPLPPTGLSALPGDREAILKWDRPAAADLSHYKVYRGTVSGTVTLLADNLPAAAYTDAGLTNGTTYYYRVAAVDILGHESTLSDPISVQPGAPADTTPPPAPSDLSATIAGSSVTLTWSASVDAGLAGYLVYRDNDLSTEIGSLNAGALTFTDLDAGYAAAHTYTVKAYDTWANMSDLATLAVGMTPTSDGWLSLATPAQQSYTLVVSTNQNNVTMTARNVGTGQLYTAANKGTKGKPAVFNAPKLPSGTYVVHASLGAASVSITLDVLNEPTSTSIEF